MHPQLSSPLFLLPYEIRLAIYEFYLLPSNQPNYYLCTPTPVETFLARGLFRRDNIPGLVLACKRLHAELAPLVFDTITFVVRHSYHHSGTALGSFGLLDFPRIRKLVYIMERTTEWAWRGHSPVFLRQHKDQGWWSWFAGALERLGVRYGGHGSFCRSVGELPTLTGLKEVVLLMGPSKPWYDEREWVSHESDVGPRRVDNFPFPRCPILDHLARAKGLQTIRLGGQFPDWWGPYLQRRTTARVLLEPSHLPVLWGHSLP